MSKDESWIAVKVYKKSNENCFIPDTSTCFYKCSHCGTVFPASRIYATCEVCNKYIKRLFEYSIPHTQREVYMYSDKLGKYISLETGDLDVLDAI